MTADVRAADVRTADVRTADVSAAVAGLIVWLETGAAPEDVFAPDCFVDLSLPHWRLQADTREDLFRIRRESHPFPGRVRVERVDHTDGGFVIAFEERWEDGQAWYCREQIRADVVDGRITEVAVYCTGDWDEAVQARHADEVPLLRA
ncbi:hypothetical protein GCM10009798_15170 [Nocardioides panacihumi]|uniref:Nuclear transport factor 2 family protein n=1 Tax=Nocardioides panacihumi TaxID=400774 RepID=A0ABN2QQS8_9ACTN